MVKKAIDKMKTRRAYDHDGLVAEHLIHAKDLLSEVLARLFNRVMCEGLPECWKLSTIVPIFKSGDPRIPGNYRTIMVGHTLTRLYASILEQKLSRWAENEGTRATGQAGFRRANSTLDHILMLRAIIEEGRASGKRMYCCFVDFQKAFDTVPRVRLMRRMQELGVPKEIIWGIMALYGSVTRYVRTPKGDSDIVHSTVGVKQGCPLSPTLFGMYLDEVSDYIDREGDRGAQLAGTWIPLLLYADDIVLMSESPEGMQRHLDALHNFAEDSGLSVNLGKTKVMVFSTTPQWVKRLAPTLVYGHDTVEYTDEYTYLGVVFTGPRFTLRRAAETRLSRAYAPLGGLERMCSQVQFQEPRTKLW
ncbi:reverse transcriptase family protein, partial [Enterobacter cloacae complex sp. GF14B]|uniref:RNA-directed DNA polymerase n=1 Tax=Enterobacter cloacae complex sp. GF14B TaxID=2511982 RepID=UPI0011132725